MNRFFRRKSARDKPNRVPRDIRIPELSGALAIAWLVLTFLAVGSDAALGNPRNTDIVVYKSRQILDLRENGKSRKRYYVCLGLEPLGPKKITGDTKTPEGQYYICLKRTASKFHRFLGISYPSATDAQKAFEKGLISLEQRDTIAKKIRSKKRPPWNTKLGGWVGIHGYPSKARVRRWMILLLPKPLNWTNGCIAMWNHEIEEIYSKVRLGTPVTILP